MLQLNQKVTIIRNSNQEIHGFGVIGSAASRLVLVGKLDGKARQFKGEASTSGFYYGIGDMTNFRIREYQTGDDELFAEHEANRQAIQAERNARQAVIEAEKDAKRETQRIEEARGKAESWAANQAHWEARQIVQTSNGEVSIVEATDRRGATATLFIHFYQEQAFDWEMTGTVGEARYTMKWNASVGNFSGKSIGGSSGFSNSNSPEEAMKLLFYRHW